MTARPARARPARPRKLTKRQRQRRALALHEAAHAVVAMVLGLGVWKVSLHGGCFTGFAKVPQPRWWHASNAIVACAGDVATHRTAPRLPLPRGQDARNARAFLRRAYGRAALDARVFAAVVTARWYVNQHWSAIRRVAARLQRGRVLDGKAVRACIEG